MLNTFTKESSSHEQKNIDKERRIRNMDEKTERELLIEVINRKLNMLDMRFLRLVLHYVKRLAE